MTEELNSPCIEYPSWPLHEQKSSPSSFNHGFGPIPQKRKKRAAFVSAFLSFVIMVVLLGAFTQPVVELKAVRVTNGTNTPFTCVTTKTWRYHVGIFIWALNLFGILLGEFTKRLCLMFEECFHLDTRYNGSKLNMVKACFSDISYKPVLFAVFVGFIIMFSTLLSQGVEYFKLEYIEIILSGIGSTSLVLYLLSFDTLSRVQISSLMENNNRLIANGLAWSFYFGYLKIILPGLQQRIADSPWYGKLSSKKLFILMPSDCFAFGKLSDEDNTIKVAEGEPIEYESERAGVFKRSYRNFVYQIGTEPNDALYILAEYATPLCSMYDMSHNKEVDLSAEDRDEQAKLFLRTVETMLANPEDPNTINKCKLVPYGRKNGIRLSQVLIEAIREDQKQEMVEFGELSNTIT